MKKNRKNDSGVSLAEFTFAVMTIVVMIIVILAEAGYSFRRKNAEKNFKFYIGIGAVSAWKTDQAARAVVQPLVTKRLGELNAAEKQACKDITFAEPATDPDGVLKELNAISEARAKCARAKEDAGKASDAARYFGFSAEAAGEK